MSANEFQACLSALKDTDPIALARLLPDRENQKFDRYVHPESLDKANAADRLDLATALQAARQALDEIKLSYNTRDSSGLLGSYSGCHSHF